MLVALQAPIFPSYYYPNFCIPRETDTAFEYGWQRGRECRLDAKVGRWKPLQVLMQINDMVKIYFLKRNSWRFTHKMPFPDVVARDLTDKTAVLGGVCFTESCLWGSLSEESGGGLHYYSQACAAAFCSRPLRPCSVNSTLGHLPSSGQWMH